MNQLDRRQSLKLFLSLLQTAGTVVVASTVLPAVAASETQQTSDQVTKKAQEDAQKHLAQRADRIAEALKQRSEGEGTQQCAFLNSFNKSFANGGFANGGFKNGGGFANGGFKNGGGFANGGFGNGGGFRNGGFLNGFRN